jgi:hypothetical protein
VARELACAVGQRRDRVAVVQRGDLELRAH